jgi:pyrimidine deaminase RibD-like protein
LLQSLNIMSRKTKQVKFKTYPSPNVGWVIYEAM